MSTVRMLEQEIDNNDALRRRIDEAVALLKDIVNRGLLPAYTENKVRDFLVGHESGDNA